MAFLRSVPLSESGPLIKGDRVWLRMPQTSDYVEWAHLRGASQEFLRPWEPEWSYDELTSAFRRRKARHYQRDMRDLRRLCFFLFNRVITSW